MPYQLVEIVLQVDVYVDGVEVEVVGFGSVQSAVVVEELSLHSAIDNGAVAAAVVVAVPVVAVENAAGSGLEVSVMAVDY
ncbi:hypothetical protein BGZ76_002292 [Entomortierella beljakovae]|nr:hypothetical protein BGZ76_002292 [Entomortierella beljakovae]